MVMKTNHIGSLYFHLIETSFMIYQFAFPLKIKY